MPDPMRGLPGYLALREILKKSEWGFGNTKECPSCGCGKPIGEIEKNYNGGHGNDCLLRSALDDLTDEAITEEARIHAKHKEMAGGIRNASFFASGSDDA